MTTISMHGTPAQREPRTTLPATRRKLLLACGVVSSLLYAFTDVLGGLRYDGYSFTSQAISELMAVGAPSERFVDPLFVAYGVLALTFGVGVLLDAGGRNRPLRLAGALMIGYALVGFTGPTLFEMHPRATTRVTGDLPHIVLTGVLSLLMLLTIGAAAFALGRRFRVYSFVTLATMIGFGAVTAPYAMDLATGQATPGLGVFERIDVYASMLWISVLSVALLRRRPAREGPAPA